MAFETNYILDGNGNIDTMSNAENRVTEYEYDVANFVVKIKDPEGYHTKYQRDPKGNVEEMWRQRNLADIEEDWELVESTIYDGLSRIHKRTPSDAPTMTYDYGYGSTGGGGGGCGCSSGFGSSIPYRVTDGDTPAGVIYNEVDLLGRTTKVVRKIGTDDGPTPDSDDSVTVYAYDPEGNLTQLTGPEGEITTMTYDGAGRMATRTVEAAPFDDLTTIYEYDGVGNVRQVTLPMTHVVNYEYDEADRLKRVYDSEGEIAFYTRDANGNVLTRADGNGNAWTYVYDALDRMAEMHDPLVETATDNVLKFKYDATGNLIERENRNVNYDPNQGPIQGVKTRYIYDDNDRLRRVVEDYVEADYDENALCGTPGYGELLDESGEGGTQGGGILQGGGTSTPGGSGGGGGGGPTTGLAACSTSTKNTVTTYEYDGRHLVKIFDHDCNVTRYEHDGSGRISSVFYPNTCGDCPNSRVLTEYSFNSRKYLKRTDQRQIPVEYFQDELGRLVQRKQYGSQNAVVRIENFAWDRSSRLIGAEGEYDANNNPGDGRETQLAAWTRTYDLAGRPITETQYFSGTLSASYETDIAYTLDTSGKTLTQEVCYPSCGQRIVSRVWDGRGRVKSANAGSNIGADWTFDAGNRRIGEFRRNGAFNFSQFDYDVNDRMTGLNHSTYLGGIDPSVIASLGYGYDAEGNRDFTENYLATERSEAYGHDNRNRLTKMSRGAISQNANGEWSVASGDYIDHASLASEQNWVALDRRGNWLDFRQAHRMGTANASSQYEMREVNGANEYSLIATGCDTVPETGCLTNCLPFDAPVQTPKYDYAGNLMFDPWAQNPGNPCPLPNGTVPNECKTGTTCDTTKPGCGLGQEYQYDLDNRLIRVRRDTNDQSNMASPESIKLAEYTYDVLGRRVETLEYVDATTGQVMDGLSGRPQPRHTRHVYFGLELIQEYVCDPNWPCGTELPLAREFVYGDPARYPEVVAMITHHLDPVHTENYHYLHDVLGSVIGLVDDAGELVERYTYDPYGKVFIEKWDAAANGGAGAWLASAEPTSGLPVSSVGNPFMWTGHRYDAAVGLYTTHFRTYSPTLGRWLQRDPIEYTGGSVNLYEYVASAPLAWVDPLGLQAIPTVPGGPVGPPPTIPLPFPGGPLPPGPGGTAGGVAHLWGEMDQKYGRMIRPDSYYPDQVTPEMWRQGGYRIRQYGKFRKRQSYDWRDIYQHYGAIRFYQNLCANGKGSKAACDKLRWLRDLLKLRRMIKCMKDCMESDEVVPVLCNQPASPKNLHDAKKNKCAKICEDSTNDELPENGGKGFDNPPK